MEAAKKQGKSKLIRACVLNNVVNLLFIIGLNEKK